VEYSYDNRKKLVENTGNLSLHYFDLASAKGAFATLLHQEVISPFVSNQAHQDDRNTPASSTF